MTWRDLPPPLVPGGRFEPLPDVPSVKKIRHPALERYLAQREAKAA